MVVRKSSIPYPTSPPPPPPPELFGQQSHHQLDSADVPPVPSMAPRAHAGPSFEEMGNPWNDEHGAQPDKSHQVPQSLKPGRSGIPDATTHSLQNLPDVLRPGWSGEATPRSSIDSDRSPDKEWWDDEPAEEDGDPNTNDPAPIQSSLTIKRKPLPQGQPPQSQPQGLDLPSNNPYRRPSETYLEATNDLPDWDSDSRQEPDRAERDHPNPLRSHPSTDRLGNLTLADPSSEKIAVIPEPAAPPPPPPQQPPPPIPQIQAPMAPSYAAAPAQQVPDGNSWDAQDRASPAPSAEPSPMPFAPSKQHQTISTNDLLDRGQRQGSLSLGDELKALPNAKSSPSPSGPSEMSLLDDAEDSGRPLPIRAAPWESGDMYAPPPSPPQSAPMKPPRPAVVTSEHDLARMREQRNETYQIKHFNWHDPRSSRIRRSSMLTQNKNGPCPLLALVNALILGATEDMQAALDEALRLREQVTLGLIIETLMDELLTKATMTQGLVLPEIDELNRFLMRLRTGMNANPRFVPPPVAIPNFMDADSPVESTPAPQYQMAAGTFEATQDIKLYESFNVKLVHGWLPRPGDPAAKAFHRSAQTYEDAQAVQFGEEELEYKLSHGGLIKEEQQVWEDITAIKQFFQTYPTQLTPYGLEAVQSSLEPGEFAILFRNDHFSTIYKHPHNRRLYTLITDAGYADRDEIIWESLEDINGARSEFFSGEFSSVSHGDSRHAMPHSQTAAANPQRSRTTNAVSDIAQALTPQQQQEQHDADFAMALQLQEEEEQRMRRGRAQNQGGRGGGGGGGGGGRGGTRNQGTRRGQGIPIPLTRNNNLSSSGEVRPLIPPRNAQSRNPGVNRPSDANAIDAPPAYEEAARTSPYVPPIGSPLHPSSTHDLTGHASTSMTNIHASGQTTGVTNGPPRSASYDYRTNAQQDRGDARSGQYRRRTSAYGENNDHWNQHSPDYSASTFGPSYAFMSPTGETRRREPARRGDDRDCLVM